MAIIYQEAGGDTINLLEEVVRDYHPEKEDLRIGMVFCTSVDKKGDIDGKPSLKNCGFPAAAKVSLVSAKDRIHKKIDVLIMIDGAGWSQMSEDQRRAILDHEMEHVQIDLSAEPSDDGRPKLVMKEEDYCVWGFRSVALRHGNNSMEVACAKQLLDFAGDVLWQDHSAAMLKAKSKAELKEFTENGTLPPKCNIVPLPSPQTTDGPDSAIDAPQLARAEKISLEDAVSGYKNVRVQLHGESNTVQLTVETSNGLRNKHPVIAEDLLDNSFFGMKVKKVEAGVRLANGSVRVIPNTIKLVSFK